MRNKTALQLESPGAGRLLSVAGRGWKPLVLGRVKDEIGAAPFGAGFCCRRNSSDRAIPMMAETHDVQYVVLPDATNPFLLARVRWPDVFQAISPVRPDWQDDPGLFDLPYEPTAVLVTPEHAAAIAAEWGADLSFDPAARPRPSLIRRMPSDWSNLSRAEKRAWSIEFMKTTPRDPDTRSRRRWFRRRRPVSPMLELVLDDERTDGDNVIDLTGARADGLATADDA
jgi:hypothetical protein